jgi:hypothetical protein
MMLALLLFVVPPLNLPPRPADAPGGTAFARSVAGLGREAREQRIANEVLAGNVPASSREFVPVTVSAGGATATYHVAPDYLAVGSDDDPFLVPLTPATAQAIADRLGCALPTAKMVDDIYAAAAVKLTPEPIPPSPAMTTVPVFLDHNARVLAQRRSKPARGLVAGHKKDVVIAGKVVSSSENVAIYGWHRPDGTPIQPLYTGHAASWVDYSHGVRLVRRRLIVNGAETTLEAVLADPKLAPLLSGEGVMRQTRYLSDDPLRSGPGEAFDVFRLDPGVRVAVQRPEPLDGRPVLLVVYALPNGNTIEQTVGKPLLPGDDWHFDIQHVGAKARFVRERLADRNLVVAYLENDLRSWPSWRKAHGDAGIPRLFDALRNRFAGPDARLVLSGHSGGGSLTFGLLNALPAVPDDVERIAFLDSNYAYDTAAHRDKLVAWLKGSSRRALVVLAYDDASARLDGKPFVSVSGGTWGRSRQMMADLEPIDRFASTRLGPIERRESLGGRVVFLLKENPERAIYHTVQVERNGVIACLLAATPVDGAEYTYFADRAYARFLRRN